MGELKVKFLMGPSDCNDKNIPAYGAKFLEDLGKAMGEDVVSAKMHEVKKQPLPIYFIASGGAEEGFKEAYTHTNEPYILLTTPAYNSLAAAMEILGFLHEHHLNGEILHGSVENIAKRLIVLQKVAQAKEKIKKMKLGCFGEPGGLIASNVNFESMQKITGMEILLFNLDELVAEYHKGGYIENQYTQAMKKKSFNQEEVEKALNVYGALKRLIEKYDLQGISVKCFDLLEFIQTTGCLALAILNAEGIPAACEGDQKSLVSMVILNALTGNSGFMANPSSLDPVSNEIIFAHCTLPIDMPDSYELTTHFESGIGVAVTCDIASQPMTIFKCDDHLSRFYAGKAELLETMHRNDLCRSQMRIHLLDGTEYFLTDPISNHHIICKGDWVEVINEYFNQVNH